MRLGVKLRPDHLSATTIARRLLRIAIICWVASAPNSNAQVSSSQVIRKGGADPQPTWTVDLHPLGFGLDQEGPFRKSRSYLVSRLTRHAVALTSTGQVAIVFETLTEDRRGIYVPGTAIIHLVSIDAATGKTLSAKQWAGNEDASVIATPSGKILYEDDDRLVLYTSSLEAIASLPIDGKQEGPYIPVDYANSADGQYVLLQQGDKGHYTDTLADAETLHSIRSWASGFYVNAFTATRFARWKAERDLGQRSFYVQREGAGWTKIYGDSDCREPNENAGFATDSKIAVVSCNKVALVDLGGSISFSQQFAKNYELDDLRVGANGRRLAISAVELKKDPFWVGDPGYEKTRPRLIIYDVQNGQAIWSLVLNPKYERPFGYDLSANGSHLALLRNGSLEMYRVGACAVKHDSGTT